MHLTPFTLTFALQVAVDDAFGFVLPRGGVIVGVDSYAGVLTGSPTSVSYDLEIGGSESVANIVTHTAAGSQTYRMAALGGTNANIAVAANTYISFDVKFDSGSTPKVTGTIVVWVALDQA